MNERERTARAIAYFERCDDVGLLHQLLEQAAPRIKRIVGEYIRRGGEDDIPPPAEVGPAREPASMEEAIRTLEQVRDFSLLQALTRAIGRRIETLEIVASASLPEGARVLVPREPRFPPNPPFVPGTVQQTGTSLTVLLDDGEIWRGPASLAQRATEG